MSTIAADVTAGTVFTEDAEGKSLWTTDGLNLAAVPSVEVNISDGVDTADIKDDAVTVAKLADAVADAIPQVSMTLTDLTSNIGNIAIQVQDVQSNSLTGRFKVGIWLSTSDHGAPAAVTDFPDAGSVDKGVSLVELTANAYVLMETDANGEIDVDFDRGGDGTTYVMAEVGGKVASDSVVIT